MIGLQNLIKHNIIQLIWLELKILGDIDFYFQQYKENWAYIDFYDYPYLKGTEFETPEIRA